MRRKHDGKLDRKDNPYQLTDAFAVREVKRATALFKASQKSAHEENLLKESAQTMALTRMEFTQKSDIEWLLDRAHLLRREATIRVRAKEYEAAQNNLKESIETFHNYFANIFPDQPAQEIINELQQALALQCHVAFALRNGELLESSATELLEYNNVTNTTYKRDALSFIAQAHFARCAVESAKTTLEESIKTAEQSPIRLDLTAEYRLYAKINLFLMQKKDERDRMDFLKQEVRDPFFTHVFDPHKTQYQVLVEAKSKDFTQIYHALNKDLLLLFFIKLVQRYNGIPDNSANKSVCQYISYQIAKVYGSNRSAIHRSKQFIFDQIKLIETSNKITLFYQLFAVSPPSISLSQQEFNHLLGDYTSLLGYENKQPQPFFKPEPINSDALSLRPHYKLSK